jgi:putative ABC transport system permease protein
MRSLTLKGLLAHKLRYLLTGLAVVLGVAFMAGTMVLTDTIQHTFNGVLASANDGTDVIVRRAGSIDGDFAESRQRVDATTVARVGQVEGVKAAVGSIQGFAQLVHADGTSKESDGLGSTIGANWITEKSINPFTLASGHAPRAPGEAVIDKATADDEGWTLGDRITVMTKDGPAPLQVVGIATYGDVDGIPGSNLVATTDETAQRLFAEPGRYDSVLVSATDGTRASTLTKRIDAEVATKASGLEAISGAQDTADKQADLQSDLGFFNSFLMAFAYIALFVGTFIIYNTFSIVVAQRTKEMAMLRTVGASRWQVLRSVVLEAFVVGLVAAAVGLVAGIGLSFGLRALLGAVGLDIPSGSLVIATSTIVTSLVVGVVVSVLSAIVPAFQASKVRPIAALRDVAIDRSGVSKVRVAAGTVVTGLGVTSFALGAVASGSGALPLIGLGAMAVIVGLLVLGPVLVRPVLRVLGAPIATTGITGRYARENAHRNPKRTAATASALMIGVALVGFITILASSTNASAEKAVDRSFRADYVVDSGSWDHGFAPTIEHDLAAVPTVETTSPLRSAAVEVDGSAGRVNAVDTTTFGSLYDLDVSAGALTDVHGDGVAVTKGQAKSDHLALGDTVPFRFADGATVDLKVRAIYDATVPDLDGPWVVGLDTFEPHVVDQYDRKVFVGLTDGADVTASRAAIDAALTSWPNATVQDQAEFKKAITDQIDQLVNLIYGLLALAVIIALIGIANTLALSVHERTPELGVLRAIGMQRRQLRTAVRWEALMIALIGAAIGGMLAVAGAFGIVHALADQGFTLAIPGARMALILGLAGLAGVVAATGPARRAAKLDVLTAIAAE